MLPMPSQVQLVPHVSVSRRWRLLLLLLLLLLLRLLRLLLLLPDRGQLPVQADTSA